ncbi:MAG TPA: hypothetical protein VIL35_16355 [Vicinamibacterales bacterium]
MTGWIIRIVLLLLILRLVLRFVYGLMQGLNPSGSSSRTVKGPGTAVPLVRDPVCGTYIPRSKALASGSGDAVQYFCSEECRKAYRA